MASVRILVGLEVKGERSDNPLTELPASLLIAHGWRVGLVGRWRIAGKR
jgi:hypothetical protein